MMRPRSASRGTACSAALALIPSCICRPGRAGDDEVLSGAVVKANDQVHREELRCSGMKLASRLLRVQRGEGRLTALVVSLMFVAMAAIAIGESGIEALFFDRVGPQALPVMYLLQGGTTFVAMFALTGILGRLGPRRAYLAAPLALGVLVLAERVVLIGDVRWIYRLLWVTVTLATLVQAIFLWGTAGAVVDTRQAKRLFPIFGAGGILGAVLGGQATRPLALAIGTENLLLVWEGGLGGAFMLARLVLGPARLDARRRAAGRHVSAFQSLATEIAFVRRSRLLGWMTIAAVLFSVLFFLLYLPFARAAAARFPTPGTWPGSWGCSGRPAPGPPSWFRWWPRIAFSGGSAWPRW